MIKALIISVILLSTVLNINAGNKKKRTNRGAKESIIKGKVSLKQEEGDFTRIYLIGGTSVSTSCSDKLKPFEGKIIEVKCRIHKERIITIETIKVIPPKFPPKKK